MAEKTPTPKIKKQRKKKIEKTFKTVSLTPYLVTDLNGLVMDLNNILAQLERELISMKDLVNWQLEITNSSLLKDLKNHNDKQPASAGVYLNLKIPANIITELFNGTSGRSRYEKIFQGEVVSHLRSWVSRIEAVDETSVGYVSEGFKRTARKTRPTVSPVMNLAFADEQYCEWISHDTLKMVINGNWYLLLFSIPKRYKDRIPSAPKIRLTNNGKILFDIPMGSPYQNGLLSDRFTLGLDVGTCIYAAITVYDNLLKREVFQGTLSERVHSLYNSIKASTRQISYLHLKSEKALSNSDYAVYSESRAELVYHRRKNINKKAELAIIAAQEIAAIAHEYNCVVAVEDLSWNANTMQNGRWNRGALVNWLRHFVTLNGSRMIKVNAAYTSQECSKCSGGTTYDSYNRLLKCNNKTCGRVMDRDLSASSVIAQRGYNTSLKLLNTRSKGASYTGKLPVRDHGCHSKPLKYKGQSSKVKRKIARKSRLISSGEVNPSSINYSALGVGLINSTANVPRDGQTVFVQDSRKAALKAIHNLILSGLQSF